jgi:hypothetical protein
MEQKLMLKILKDKSQKQSEWLKQFPQQILLQAERVWKWSVQAGDGKAWLYFVFAACHGYQPITDCFTKTNLNIVGINALSVLVIKLRTWLTSWCVQLFGMYNVISASRSKISLKNGKFLLPIGKLFMWRRNGRRYGFVGQEQSLLLRQVRELPRLSHQSPL